MKGTVLKKFRDKITKSVYAAGDVIEREEARFKEINSAGGGPYIAALPDPAPGPNGKESGTESAKQPNADEKPPHTTKAKKAKEQ